MYSVITPKTFIIPLIVHDIVLSLDNNQASSVTMISVMSSQRIENTLSNFRILCPLKNYCFITVGCL